MKSILLLLALSAFTYSPGILLIDIEMKNDIKTTEKFTIEDCFKKSFPVYVEDIKAVIEAAEEMARTIDRNDLCDFSIKANHTTINLKKDCKKTQGFSVHFVTKLENEKTYFDFELIRNEKDRRLAQQRLLDFAAYLSN